MLRSDKNTANHGQHTRHCSGILFLIMVLQILTRENKSMLPLSYEDAVDSNQMFSWKNIFAEYCDITLF